jgi:hypothetical protein
MVERLEHSGLVLQHDSGPLLGGGPMSPTPAVLPMPVTGGFGSSFSSVAVWSPPTAAFALVVETLVVVTSAPSPAVATALPPAVLVPPTAAFALVKVAPAPSPTAATAVPPAVLVPPTAALALVKVAAAPTSTAAAAFPPAALLPPTAVKVQDRYFLEDDQCSIECSLDRRTICC